MTSKLGQVWRAWRDMTWTEVFTVAGIFVVLLLVLGSWPLQSYFEARAYERVTGKHVSTWDAMFLDLRVQESPK